MRGATFPVTQAILWTCLVRLTVSHLGDGWCIRIPAAITILHVSTRVEDAATLQVKPCFHVIAMTAGKFQQSERFKAIIWKPVCAKFSICAIVLATIVAVIKIVDELFQIYNNCCNHRETFSQLNDRCYQMEITLKNELNKVGSYRSVGGFQWKN